MLCFTSPDKVLSEIVSSTCKTTSVQTNSVKSSTTLSNFRDVYEGFEDEDELARPGHASGQNQMALDVGSCLSWSALDRALNQQLFG